MARKVRALKLFSRALVLFSLAGFLAWAVLAVWIDGPSVRWLGATIVVVLIAYVLCALSFVRPMRRGVVSAAVAPALVLVWWLTLSPSNHRDWYPDVARLPVATVEGNQLTVRNLRNFEYRSEHDYTEQWETRSYDLSKLVGMDLFISFWGPTLYGHTISSWEFSDGSHLAISIETRKEKGEAYSAVLGFFRQYELYYVVADERDVVGVRAEHRGEQVRLYRLAASAPRARKLLLDFVNEMNELVQRPTWYNALTTNCTTAIWKHVKAVGARWPLDWRLLANGHLDEMAYERGAVNRAFSLAELRERSDVTALAHPGAGDPGFSTRIREGLPERPKVAAAMH